MNNISNSWTIYKLKECFLPITITKKMKSKNYLKHGKFPIIDQGKNLVSGYCDDETMLIKIDTPVIVFGDHTRCFKFVNFNFVAGADGIKILKPKANFDAKLFYYFCQILNFPNKGYARHYQYLIKTDINFPREQAEQNLIVKKIESCFEKIDFAISNFKKSKELIEIYKQSVLSHAFNGKLTNSNLNSWQVKKLGEIAVTSSGGTPSRNNAEFWENGSFYWIKSGELSDDYINYSEEKITQLAIDNSSSKILDKNTILVAMYGATVGKLGILNTQAATNQAICAIANKQKPLFCVKFLYYYLLSIRPRMINDAFGGAQKNISQSYLRQLPIPLPALSEQNLIVSEIEKRFKAADSALNLIEQNLKKAEILKQSILSKAFNGRLVKDKK